MPTPQSTHDPVHVSRSRLAVATRRGDVAAATEARRDMKAGMLARRIQEAIDSAPPLTDAQRAQLSRLLLAGGAAK